MKQLQINSLLLPNCLVTAPMAGITGRAFRDILRAQGAGLVYGEMISAQALCYGNRRTFELLGLDGEAFPRGVQLCGGDPKMVAEAAAIVEEKGASIIDINMGCPAPKIVKNREGSYLMCHPALAGEIIKRVKEEVKVPVTAKIRSGWDEQSINCVEFAKILEASGVDAITVHGRTRNQFYSGKANWEYIKGVKKAVEIPVIGNGDIFSAFDAIAMLKETGCDGVMAGRGLLGNPWLVSDIISLLKGEKPQGKPSKEEIISLAMEHLREQVAFGIAAQEEKKPRNQKDAAEAELAGVKSMRGHLSWYIKGMKNSAAMRNHINQLTTIPQLEAAFSLWLEEDRINSQNN